MHLLMIKSRKTKTPPTCLYESPHFHSQYDQEIKAFAALANIKLNVYFKIQILFYIYFCSCSIRYYGYEKMNTEAFYNTNDGNDIERRTIVK